MDTFDASGTEGTSFNEVFKLAAQDFAGDLFNCFDRGKLEALTKQAAAKLSACDQLVERGRAGGAAASFGFQGRDLQEAAEELKMAVPMILALTICPAILGTQEAIRQSQSKNKREEHRARRCNLVVSCVKPSIRSRDIHGKLAVLKDNKIYITTSPPVDNEEEEEELSRAAGSGYPFSGYYLPYPDTAYEGMVSTISDDPPMLNWIYVDRATHEVKYGLRADAQAHITGPFDCTRQDRRLTLQGWEGFVAVEELPGTWALYFDADDDGLGAKVPMGTRVLEVELTRREKKERRPQPDPSQAQTLDEMMRQHKEQSRREEEERQRDLGSDELGGQQNTVEETTRWQPDADAPPPEQQSAARPQPEIEQDLGRLNIGAGVSPEHSPIAVFSPSVATDSMSFWSRAREAGDGDDLASVTAASSVGERGGQARPEPTTPPGEPGYKQPEPSTPPGEPGYKQAEPNTPPREEPGFGRSKPTTAPGEPGFGRSKPTTAPGEPGYRRPYVEDEMPEEQAEDSVNEGGV